MRECAGGRAEIIDKSYYFGLHFRCSVVLYVLVPRSMFHSKSVKNNKLLLHGRYSAIRCRFLPSESMDLHATWLEIKIYAKTLAGFWLAGSLSGSCVNSRALKNYSKAVYILKA